jgi:DNA modification methylase
VKVETISIDKLIPDPSNSRLHNSKNIDAIKGSLAKFKQVEPLVVQKSTNIIIAGNGRYSAMKALGVKEVDVHFVDVDNTTAIAMSVALNRSAELGSWNEDILKEHLESLKKDDWDLSALGFDVDDLSDFGVADLEKEAIEDEVPEVPKETFVKLGDMFQLGSHKLLCADCTIKENVDRLMNGEKADMVFTDPPYGFGYEGNFYQDIEKSGFTRDSKRYDKLKGDSGTWDFDATQILEQFRYCEDIFLWGADYYCWTLPKNGSWVCWNKISDNDKMDNMPGASFELCWSKSKHKRHIFNLTWRACFGHNKQVDGDKKVHPTQKPVKLAELFFDKWGKDKTNIVDLYGGSGSTLIACEKTKRKAFLMEIDPHYCQIILERFQKYSGKQWVKING